MILTKALLGLLSRGEQHGYKMKTLVDAEFSPYWRLPVSQLYRALARMSRSGWVKSRVELGDGPDRKVYRLTPLGRQVLGEWLGQPASDHDEFFVKWRMSRDLGQPVEELVAEERARLRKEFDVRALSLREAGAARDINRITVAEAALSQVEAELASLKLCESLSDEGAAGAVALPRYMLLQAWAD